MIIRDSVAVAARRLEGAGIEAGSREAWLLLGEILGWDRATLLAHAQDELDQRFRNRFFDLVERRSRREPIAQIFGRKEFWSLPFAISRDVLCPRPDSETLIEMALMFLKGCGKQEPRILDLGAGSGCLALTLLHEHPNARAVGVDRSMDALRIAQANGRRLGLASRTSWLCANWGTALSGPFDLIVSNPPYISVDEWFQLEPEVRLFEPELALMAGPDGLDAYRQVAPDLKRLLAPDGLACLEHGLGQAASIRRIMSKAGLSCAGQRRDLSGIDRCLALTGSGAPSNAKIVD